MKKSTAHQHQYLIPTVKHRGGKEQHGLGCFAATETGRPVIIERTINSKGVSNILQVNVRAAINDLKETERYNKDAARCGETCRGNGGALFLLLTLSCFKA